MLQKCVFEDRIEPAGITGDMKAGAMFKHEFHFEEIIFHVHVA
jgi:hypothetical protein